MPAHDPKVNVDLQLVPSEDIDRLAPIVWGNDLESRTRLFRDNTKWLRENPIQKSDNVLLVVEREIRSAIQTVLDNPNPDAVQEIEFEYVERSIKSDSKITGDFEVDCLFALDRLWVPMSYLLLSYTKPAPDNA